MKQLGDYQVPRHNTNGRYSIPSGPHVTYGNPLGFQDYDLISYVQAGQGI